MEDLFVERLDAAALCRPEREDQELDGQRGLDDPRRGRELRDLPRRAHQQGREGDELGHHAVYDRRGKRRRRLRDRRAEL